VPSRGYVEIVENRPSTTLLDVINCVFLPHSVMLTDEWKEYSKIYQINSYFHKQITHKYHLVDPISGTHIQNAGSINNN
ncbi:hypothetical protein H311_00398, partial [Anncaliia algerae PRA109]